MCVEFWEVGEVAELVMEHISWYNRRVEQENY